LANRPLVSIALPVFNAEKTLAIAIRSILNQTYPHWELIIVDDGSTDGSLTIARNYKESRIRILGDGKNRGISFRLNEAIHTGFGKYFARMDADDVAFPRRIEAQVDYLESHPQVDLLGTGRLVFDGKGIIQGIVPVQETHESITSKPWSGFNLAHPTWMGKRELFLVKGYRTLADKAEDQDFLFRNYKTSRFACLPGILLGYKENPRSLKKMLNARYVYVKALSSEAVREKEYLLAFQITLIQMAKMIGDVLNIKLGMRRFRNQLSPADDALTGYWAQLWDGLNGS